MIASENQVSEQDENAPFIQILISFYIQSEVVTLSAFSIYFSVNLKNGVISVSHSLLVRACNGELSSSTAP